MLKKILVVTISLIFLTPNFVMALEMPATGGGLAMPTSGNDLANMAGISAQAYIVQDVSTGEVLISKNADLQWTPASLTKLVTALVVLDTKPKLTRAFAITAADQSAGACGSGGACIKAKPGVMFTIDGLFHAALMPSANNAANALARSTGLTNSQFALKMNQKVQSLGATGSSFVEPTGMSTDNKITAGDYAKVVAAAFSNSYLRNISALSKYTLRSTNNSGYNQTIKNTDKLLADSDVEVLGAKTGYLNESLYNFGSLVKYNGGDKLAIVVLGESHLYMAFDETKQLLGLAEETRFLSLMHFGGAVLGTSTSNSQLTISAGGGSASGGNN